MILPRDITQSIRYPVIILESFLSHHFRHKLHSIAGFFLALLVIVEVTAYTLNYFDLLENYLRDVAIFLIPKIAGLALIFAGIWITVFMLEAFFRSKYFKETEESTKVDYFLHEVDLLSLEVGRIMYCAKQHGGDITKGLFLSDIGKHILLRSGVGREDQEYFLNTRTSRPSYGIQIPVSKQGILFTLPDLAAMIFSKDTELKEFLFTRGIQVREFRGAAEWVWRENEESKRKERWWTRENLSKIPGIGKDWSYGGAYKLRRYGQEITGVQYEDAYIISLIKRERELDQLENILSRVREANALLVGEPGVGIMDLVRIFTRRVHSKTIKEYFHILEDTLIGFLFSPYGKSHRTKTVAHPKFYFFDCGIVAALRNELSGNLISGAPPFGKAFEHLILMELIAYADYSTKNYGINYWRSASGIEVDFILGNQIAVEVKTTTMIDSHHTKNIRALMEEGMLKSYYVVSFDQKKRITNENISIIPWQDFIDELWDGEII